jgi:hypothetical protein
LPQQGTDADRRQRQVFGLFAEVELFLKSVDSVLTGPQQAQFGIGPKSKAKAKKLVSALKDLQWLPWRPCPAMASSTESKSEFFCALGVAVMHHGGRSLSTWQGPFMMPSHDFQEA